MQPSDEQHIFTVSQLNREVRLMLEQQFGFVWLEAEISNLSRPASGHWYLSLKDSNAQIRCAMFRGRNRLLKFDPQNGDQVLVRGALGLYEARGEFQLVLDRMEPVGEGLLQRQFEQIKRKLLADGLFDEHNKQPLPTYPKTIGIITSATGAAVRDVLHVLERRYPAASVIVYPTAVQAEQSVAQIAAALDTADKRGECDVLLLVRGGGSLEDLWSFNEEQVARAIHRCHLPIVSGVGHETDTTIADMVADVRAPTPSAAAEIATPDSREELLYIQSLRSSITSASLGILASGNRDLNRLHQRLLTQHPRKQLQQKSQRIDELEQRVINANRRQLKQYASNLDLLEKNLFSVSPAHSINLFREKLVRHERDLGRLQQDRIHQEKNRLKMAMRALNSVSPLATLDRGYAVVRTNELKTVGSIHGVKSGDKITATVRDGDITCLVEDTVERI